MKVQILKQIWNVGGIVEVRGNFQGWTDGDTLNADGVDSIYSATFSFPAETTINYKFYEDPPGGASNGYELLVQGNRTAVLGAADTTLHADYFSNDSLVNSPINVNVMFQVDMTPMIQEGIFRPDLRDSVHIRGQFNGWADGNPSISVMLPWADNRNIYQIIIPYSGFVNDQIFYKFYIKYDSAHAASVFPTYALDSDPYCYEHPYPLGDGNRELTLTSVSDTTLPSFYFDGLNPSGIIAQGDTVMATWQVNMEPAVHNVASSFVPGTDTAWIFFLDAVWLSLQPQINPNTGLRLTHAHDSIYTGTEAIHGTSSDGVLYVIKYGHSGAYQMEGANSGVTGADRARFIPPTSPNHFPTAYLFPVDSWQPNAPYQDENPPFTVITGVRTPVKPSSPRSFSLSQNFPNPFNPSTHITYSLAAASDVRLTVYDILGRELSVPVNGRQAGGDHEFLFDASNIASGVYFYRLVARPANGGEVASFVQTKTMVVLR
jgi:hypothetical protein